MFWWSCQNIDELLISKTFNFRGTVFISFCESLDGWSQIMLLFLFFSWPKKNSTKFLERQLELMSFIFCRHFIFFWHQLMSRVIYRHHKNLRERNKIGKHFSKVFHISSEISPVLHLLTTMVKVVMVKSLSVEQPSSFLRKIFAPHSSRETNLAWQQSSIFLLLSFHNNSLLEALFVGYVCIFGVPLKSH